MKESRQVFVIIRADAPEGLDTPSEDLVTVQKVVNTQEFAEQEVERLTRGSAGKPIRYFWQAWSVETGGD
jgi:hypothetical protein